MFLPDPVLVPVQLYRYWNPGFIFFEALQRKLVAGARQDCSGKDGRDCGIRLTAATSLRGDASKIYKNSP